MQRDIVGTPSVCYTTVPLCHNWPEEFISDFTHESEYCSQQTVLGSGSSFNPFRRPAGHSRNFLYAIRRSHYAGIGPKNSFPILHMRVNITACRLFWFLEVRLSHSLVPTDRVGTHCMLSDAATISKLAQRFYFQFHK